MICQLAIFQQLTKPVENFFPAFSTDTPSAQISCSGDRQACPEKPSASLRPSHCVGPSRSLPRAARFPGATCLSACAAIGYGLPAAMPVALRRGRHGFLGQPACPPALPAAWREPFPCGRTKIIFRAPQRHRAAPARLPSDCTGHKREIQPNSLAGPSGWIYLWQNGFRRHFHAREVQPEGRRRPF